MSQLIDGRKIAARITDEVKAEIKDLGIAPGLAVVLVGDDPPSHLYVGIKERACSDVGIRFEKHLLPATVGSHEVIALIESLNRRDDIQAILVQLPLPDQLDTEEIVAAMDPKKDVDGFHPENVAAFLAGDAAHEPVLVAAVMTLLAETGTSLAGKTAAVIANSEVFAEPLMAALSHQGARPGFFSALHLSASRSPLAPFDIIIVAAGVPGLITGGMLKPGSIVIDIGTNKVDGKLIGDVDAASSDQVAAWRTPVPGGVGPVTVAMLLKNVTELIRKAKQND